MGCKALSTYLSLLSLVLFVCVVIPMYCQHLSWISRYSCHGVYITDIAKYCDFACLVWCVLLMIHSPVITSTLYSIIQSTCREFFPSCHPTSSSFLTLLLLKFYYLISTKSKMRMCVWMCMCACMCVYVLFKIFFSVST